MTTDQIPPDKTDKVIPPPRQGYKTNPDSAGTGDPVQDYKIIDGEFGLKILIVGLGVLLLVAALTFVFLLVTVGIDDNKQVGIDDNKQVGINDNKDQVDKLSQVSTKVSEQLPLNMIELAPGEEITHMALGDGDLALHLKSPTGERILIVNPYTAGHKSVIQITTSMPANSTAQE